MKPTASGPVLFAVGLTPAHLCTLRLTVRTPDRTVIARRSINSAPVPLQCMYLTGSAALPGAVGRASTHSPRCGRG